MATPLLRVLAKYHKLVDNATKGPVIVVPSGLDFVPGAGYELESMIWILTYAIMLHHQGSDKRAMSLTRFMAACLTLDSKRSAFLWWSMVSEGPEEWIPDPAQCTKFRRVMTLLARHIVPPFDASVNI